MKTRVIYTRGFFDTETGEHFTADRSLKGWRLKIVSAVVSLLTIRHTAFRGLPMFCFGTAAGMNLLLALAYAGVL
jgi:hypothetical protein